MTIALISVIVVLSIIIVGLWIRLNDTLDELKDRLVQAESKTDWIYHRMASACQSIEKHCKNIIIESERLKEV